MGAQPTGVLTPDDLNATDGRVLDVLREGRVTPQYAAEKLDVSRTYASERLKRLVEHGHVSRLASGLYELVDDPREEDSAEDPDVDLQAVLAERDELATEVASLEQRLEDCRAELEQARREDTSADAGGLDPDTVAAAHDSLQRALEDLPDVPGRTAVQDAAAQLGQVLDE